MDEFKGMARKAVKPPGWDLHIEWLDLYPLVSAVFGRPWRGDPEGQNTYRTVVVDSEGPEDFWDEFDRSPLQVLQDWRDQVPPDDMGGYSTMPELWWERESNPPDTGLVMWYLHSIGLIPPGRYLVTTWW